MPLSGHSHADEPSKPRDLRARPEHVGGIGVEAHDLVGQVAPEVDVLQGAQLTVGSWHFPMPSLDRPQPKIPEFPTPTNSPDAPHWEYASASVVTASLISSG